MGSKIKHCIQRGLFAPTANTLRFNHLGQSNPFKNRINLLEPTKDGLFQEPPTRAKHKAYGLRLVVRLFERFLKRKHSMDKANTLERGYDTTGKTNQ